MPVPSPQIAALLTSALCVWEGSSSVVLSTEELAAHNHTGSATSAGAHTHGLSQLWGYTDQNWRNGFFDRAANGSGAGFSSDSAGGHSHSVSINSTGKGTKHENRQPYQAVSRWYRSA